MHVLEYLHRNVKTVAMPTAMVVGALLCRPVTALEGWTHQMITPSLIFLMLFVTFLPRQAPADEAFDAAFLAAAVSGRGERGGLFPAAAAESHRGTGGDDLCAGRRGDGRGGDRRDARGQCPDDGYIQPRVQHGDRARGARRSVAGRDGGMLLHADTGAYRAAAHHALRGCAVLPFRTARSGEMDRGSQSDFILHVARIAGGDHRPYDGLYPRFARCFARDPGLWLAFAALVICLVQFKVGRSLGRRYGDAPAGGQSLGQKNTVLAVWMAQSFLDPISSIAPTAYIVWQNFVNSYQIWKKDKESRIN